MYKKIFALLSIFYFCSCNHLPKSLRTPESPQNSIIGISVKTRSLIRIFKNQPDTVYFVKLQDDDSFDSSSRILPSNYSKGGYTYLIGVQPGKYAVIASTYTKSEMSYSTFYNIDTIKKVVVQVGAGEMIYAGNLIIDDELKSIYQNIEKNGDKAQIHYFSLLKSTLNGVYYCGILKEYSNNELLVKQFLVKAREHLKDSGWLNVINKVPDPQFDTK